MLTPASAKDIPKDSKHQTEADAFLRPVALVSAGWIGSKKI